MWNDPIVEEIRTHSAQLAAQFNYDVYALGKYYQEQQRLQNRPVVSRPPRYRKPLPTSNSPTPEAEKVA
jgi:hypothetical protein